MTDKAFGNFWSTIWLGTLLMLAFVWSPDGYATQPNDPPGPDQQQDQAQGQAQRQEQGQSQGQEQGQQQSATADNAGNSQSIAFNGPKMVPSIYAGSNYPTAPCLATFSIGGSAQGGGGLVSLNLDKKDCQLVSYSQAFAALQQYQMACDLMRAVKGVREAYRKVYGSNVPACTWPEPKELVPTVTPADSSVYARRDELEKTRAEFDEKLRRQTETLAGK